MNRLDLQYTTVFSLLVVLFLVTLTSCTDTKCFSNSDCQAPKYCNTAIGECVYECEADTDCGSSFLCNDNRCIPKENPPVEAKCPDDMAKIAGSFCMDIYEASRVDATKDDEGVDRSKAISKQGVMPWQVSNNRLAEIACNESGKRLCTEYEWTLSCKGEDKTVYAYGDDYEAETCNGIDTFGRSKFHLLTTGELENCKNSWGVYDLNGNLWEHVANGSDKTIRGGAYNCSNSAQLHQCEYIPGNWAPSARGFRCCKSLEEDKTDGDLDIDKTDKDVDPLVLIDGDSVDLDEEEGDTPTCLGEEDEDIADIEEDKDILTDTDKDKIELESDETDKDPEMQDAEETDIPIDGDLDIDTEKNDSEITEVELDPDLTDTTDQSTPCPSEMVLMGTNVCVDKYEASRSDATDKSYGVSSVMSVRKDVLPWMYVTLSSARSACQAAGKRLCKADEWLKSCEGTSKTNYVYGDVYQADICNGIDVYCRCDNPNCSSTTTCPYPHCIMDCGADFTVMPTGSFPSCVNEWGAYDINGNVWEVVESIDGKERFRGGAYNCSNSENLHRCDFLDGIGWPSAKGFRCCKDAVLK